ncbi:MAG: pseudouridine synthase [Candidatus Methanoperedens sp.]|nr:pseudouridine synthase [Candidatus Methanoperedens sp.]MCZ7369965.1 pseudouridine synthase [Candidatus Methanoperedens sp.]
MLAKISHLKRVRTIADYQFGRGAGEILFPETVRFQFSMTKRVRQILLDNNRIATVRAQDGMLTLGITGAKLLHEFIKHPGQRVVVNSDSAPFVARGKNAFAKHVVSADTDIRAGQEVLVVDEDDRFLATGKSVLSANEMIAFKKGMAVEVRHGIESGEGTDDD